MYGWYGFHLHFKLMQKFKICFSSTTTHKTHPFVTSTDYIRGKYGEKWQLAEIYDFYLTPIITNTSCSRLQRKQLITKTWECVESTIAHKPIVGSSFGVIRRTKTIRHRNGERFEAYSIICIPALYPENQKEFSTTGTTLVLVLTTCWFNRDYVDILRPASPVSIW